MTYVRMTTSAGEIDIELYTDECPETTGNFLKLVDDGYYDGCHASDRGDFELIGNGNR